VIGIDHGLHQLREHKTANVIDIISSMRECRGGMVQHPEQAAFVHTTLQRFANSHGSFNELAVLEDALSKACISGALAQTLQRLITAHHQPRSHGGWGALLVMVGVLVSVLVSVLARLSPVGLCVCCLVGCAFV
jgi:hypothetical protein